MIFPSHRLVSAFLRPGPVALAALYALSSMARAFTSTVLALHSYAIYKAIDPGKAGSFVSATFALISLCSLFATFAIPRLFHSLGVKRAYFFGNLFAIAAAAILATGSLAGLWIGILGRAIDGVVGSTCIILLTVLTIPRQGFVVSESLRLVMGSIAWGAGPVAGVFLFSRYGILGPSIAVILTHFLLIFYLHQLKLSDRQEIKEAPPPANPLRLIRRFAGQRQMRLAWLIVFCRSSWWSMFFTYPALYLADRNLGTSWAGWLTGVGNMLLIASPLVRWLANRQGLRKPIIGAFCASSAIMMFLPLVYDYPALTCLFLLGAACSAIILDSLGNIPFMRFARPSERQKMTAVFRTYVDAADLLSSAFFAMLLLFFDFRAIFIASGFIMLLGALAAANFPKRL